MFRLTVFACLIQFILCGSSFSQDPVKILATNNSGFIQTLPGGPDNLVLFEFVPAYPEEGDPPAPPLPAQFQFIGNLDSGVDLDGNGFEESVGTFTGLEWSNGVPGGGTLIGCTRNDNVTEVSNGEFYQIDPNTGETELIGAAPQGRVVSLVPNGTGYVPFPLPGPCAQVIGGSGGGLCLNFNVSGDGLVFDLTVAGPGQGYEVGDVVRLNGAPFQDATFVITQVDGSEFADLAFDRINNRMVAVMNNYVLDENGQVTDFGINSIWIDTDNDRVPDANAGILFDPAFAPIATLIGGMHIDDEGTYYFYDTVGGLVLFAAADDFPILASGAELAVAGVQPSLLREGNGIARVGDTVAVAIDSTLRDTFVASVEVADLNPEEPGLAYGQIVFPQGFSQGVFQAQVAIGDMVPAESDLSDLPPVFPDSVIINNGSPGQNAVLEAVVVSDDFRYCVAGTAPTKTAAPIDVSFLFTIPNPSLITTLGIAVESQANVDNLRSEILVQNVKTGEFEQVDAGNISFGSDETITVDLTASIANYVNMTNGTMTCRVQTSAVGTTLFFPWQIKYDSVLAVAE